MIASPDLTVINARLAGGEDLFSLSIVQGAFGTIAPMTSGPIDGEILNLGGRLVLPAMTEGHIHLDKTFLGLPWRPHRPANSIAGRIAAERTERATLNVPLKDRARRLIDRVIGYGTLAMRSHIDIDEALGLSHVEALLELRAEVGDRIDLQFVAFPQSGITARVAALMREALALGVDVVGGLDPAGIDSDIDGPLAVIFGLAERYGRPIDIHLHDPGALGCYELRRIAEKSKAAGMQGRVAVSHAFALGMVDDTEFKRTAEALAAGGVAIMTNGPGADAIPPVKRLIAEGVRVFGGCDNIRDAWSPFGTGDLLQRAGVIGYRSNFRSDDDLRLAFDLVTKTSRAVLGLPPIEIAPGSPADFFAMFAEDTPEAVATAPTDRMVFRAGQRVI